MTQPGKYTVAGKNKSAKTASPQTIVTLSDSGVKIMSIRKTAFAIASRWLYKGLFTDHAAK